MIRLDSLSLSNRNWWLGDGTWHESKCFVFVEERATMTVAWRVRRKYYKLILMSHCKYGGKREIGATTVYSEWQEKSL